MDTFSKGEMAIYVHPGKHYGKEVEILGDLRSVLCRSESSGLLGTVVGYQITHIFNVGIRSWVEPYKLRKKRPPKKEKTGTWTDGNNLWIPDLIKDTMEVQK